MRIKSPVIKRSIVLAGHKTSVSLEDAFWEGLRDIAIKRRMSLSALAGTIQAQRQQANLSSAIRLFVLEFYRSPVPGIEGYPELHEKSAQSAPLLSDLKGVVLTGALPERAVRRNMGLRLFPCRAPNSKYRGAPTWVVTAGE